MSHLDHLRTFIEAYRLQSFSKAAGSLGITQPAASMHIQALETFVGKPLFVRKPRGVIATEAADELARAVGPMLDGLEKEISGYRIGGGLNGTVHIAGPSDFYAGMASKLTPLFAQGIRIRLHTGNRDRIYQLLDASAVDLAITASLPNERNHSYARLLTERFLLVMSPKLASKIKGMPTQEQLSSIPLIAYDEDLPLIRPVWTMLFKHAPPIQATLTIPDLRTIQDMVVKGEGWSVLPDYQCSESIKSGRLINVSSSAEAPTNDLNLVWRKSSIRNPRTMYVRDYLLNLFNIGANRV